jgi:hypothetical protein
MRHAVAQARLASNRGVSGRTHHFTEEPAIAAASHLWRWRSGALACGEDVGIKGGALLQRGRQQTPASIDGRNGPFGQVWIAC